MTARGAAVVALALATAVACNSDDRQAAPPQIEVGIRNARAEPVSVRPWPGASAVSVPAGHTAVVSGDVPPDPWEAELTVGGRTTRHEISLHGARIVIVTASGLAVEPALGSTHIQEG